MGLVLYVLGLELMHSRRGNWGLRYVRSGGDNMNVSSISQTIKMEVIISSIARLCFFIRFRADERY